MKKSFVAKCLSFLMLCNTASPLINAQNKTFNCDTTVVHSAISENFANELNRATETLKHHPGVLELSGEEIAVVGDIHGDVLTMNTIIAHLAPWLNANPSRKVLFLGDIFDRGDTTTSMYLFLEFFNQFSKGNVSTDRVFILRGNHESAEYYLGSSRGQNAAINESVISENETEILEYMDELPYAAILNGNTLAVHGGIPSNLYSGIHGLNYQKLVGKLFGESSPKPKGLPDTTTTGRSKSAQQSGIEDIIWSDFSPNPELHTFKGNHQRMVGCIYGWKQLKEFFETLGNVNNKYQNVRHIIHGHNHIDGPWQKLEEDGMTNTTVISSIVMNERVHNANVDEGMPKRGLPCMAFTIVNADGSSSTSSIYVKTLRKLVAPWQYFLAGTGIGITVGAAATTIILSIFSKTNTNEKLNPNDKKQNPSKNPPATLQG